MKLQSSLYFLSVFSDIEGSVLSRVLARKPLDCQHCSPAVGLTFRNLDFFIRP